MASLVLVHDSAAGKLLPLLQRRAGASWPDAAKLILVAGLALDSDADTVLVSFSYSLRLPL